MNVAKLIIGLDSDETIRSNIERKINDLREPESARFMISAVSRIKR